MSNQGGQANWVLGIWSLLSPQSRFLAYHNLAPAHGFRGCRVWLPPGFLPYLTLLDTSGHGQLTILLQQTYLPLHGEDVELRARAWRGGSGTHQIVDRTPQRPPCPFSFINEKLRGDMDRKPSVCRKLKGRNPIMVQFRVKSSCTSEYQFKKLGMASAEKFLGMSDYPCPNRSQSRS